MPVYKRKLNDLTNSYCCRDVMFFYLCRHAKPVLYMVFIFMAWLYRAINPVNQNESIYLPMQCKHKIIRCGDWSLIITYLMQNRIYHIRAVIWQRWLQNCSRYQLRALWEGRLRKSPTNPTHSSKSNTFWLDLLLARDKKWVISCYNSRKTSALIPQRDIIGLGSAW